jgi:hypothetical protein
MTSLLRVYSRLLNKFVISTGEVMGLWPAQGDEKGGER